MSAGACWQAHAGYRRRQISWRVVYRSNDEIRRLRQQRVRMDSRERSCAAGVVNFFDNECTHAFSI